MSEHTGNGSVTPQDEVSTYAGTYPATDFKAVAIGAGPNIEALPAYFTDPLLQTGNMPGIAISAFNNRALRQGTFVASSLCLWISGILQQYIYDDGSQINWENNFNSAINLLIQQGLGQISGDLGAFLPLAGGTMTGNILFNPGATTILSNNVWRQARDVSGTPRGLMLLGSDNNLYINDGSAAYVLFHGIPTVDNNVSWSGRTTGGAVRPVIGILSDNNIHIGNSATTDIYFDESSAAHHAANVYMANNRFIYGLDTGNNVRQMLGINNGNSLLIANAYPYDTNIYGNPIYMRNNAYALAQFQVNGYSYLQGGTRCYIAGGNDPLQIACDNGYYARTQYVILGVRFWTCGALSNAYFAIADETAHAVRWQIDTNGNITVSNSETVNGSLTVNGGQSIGGGLTIYNGLYVASGNVTFSGSLTVAGNITTNNSLFLYNGLQVYNNSNYFYVANGNGVHAPYLYSRGDIGAAGSAWISGQVQAGYIISTGDVHSNGNTTGNGIYGNYVQSYGDMRANGCFYLNGLQLCNSNGLFHTVNCGLAVDGTSYFNGPVYCFTQTQVSGNYIQAQGILYVGANGTIMLPWSNNNSLVGSGSQAFNAMCAFTFYTMSDERSKTNVAAVPSGCLDVVRQIEPQTYNLVDTPTPTLEVSRQVPQTPDPVLNTQEQTAMADAELMRKRQHWGFVAQDVGRAMQDAGLDFGGRFVSVDGQQSLGVMDMVAVLWAAVRELSDEVRQLKAA